MNARFVCIVAALNESYSVSLHLWFDFSDFHAKI